MFDWSNSNSFTVNERGDVPAGDPHAVPQPAGAVVKRKREFRWTRARRRVLLVLLLDLPGMSGFPICRAAQAGSGTVYVVLAHLERLRWVATEWETGKPAGQRRLFYRLTREGRAQVLEVLGLTEAPAYATPFGSAI